MRKLFAVFLAAVFAISAFGQSESQRIADVEKSFTDMAADKGIKTAFLEYLADTGFVFQPDQRLGKEFWRSQPDSASALVWWPVWVDIAGNGMIGYTTGPWELRPNGSESEPTSFGEFATVWQKQKDGTYKVVVDIGISHPKPEKAVSEWKSPDYAGKPLSEDPFYVADVASGFFELIGKGKVDAAYKEFAANDIRLLREGEMPIIGKSAALDALKQVKGKLQISHRMAFLGTNDLAYAHNQYRLVNGKKVVTGNFLQIWRFLDKRWQIVLDVFKPSA